jgi:hypothetical protein
MKPENKFDRTYYWFIQQRRTSTGKWHVGKNKKVYQTKECCLEAIKKFEACTDSWRKDYQYRMIILEMRVPIAIKLEEFYNNQIYYNEKLEINNNHEARPHTRLSGSSINSCCNRLYYAISRRVSQMAQRFKLLMPIISRK